MLQSSWQMKFEIFEKNAAKWGILVVWIFLGGLPEKRAQFFLGGSDLHRNYGIVVILLSFLCNYENVTLKLHQKNLSYPEEGWIFIGTFKVESVPGMSAALEASQKQISVLNKHSQIQHKPRR